MHCLETQTFFLEALPGLAKHLYFVEPIFIFAFAGLQAVYGVAADALVIPASVPARTKTAIDTAENFLETDTRPSSKATI